MCSLIPSDTCAISIMGNAKLPLMDAVDGSVAGIRQVAIAQRVPSNLRCLRCPWEPKLFSGLAFTILSVCMTCFCYPRFTASLHLPLYLDTLEALGTELTSRVIPDTVNVALCNRFGAPVLHCGMEYSRAQHYLEVPVYLKPEYWAEIHASQRE